jgi:regulator of protease activity HflC (stomatin/prohibitin superfamily)
VLDASTACLLVSGSALSLALGLHARVVVPKHHAFVVELMGKYLKTIRAGTHFMVPVLDRVVAPHDLREQALEVPDHVCVSKDDVAITARGIIYLSVFDPEKATYLIDDYRAAVIRYVQRALNVRISTMGLERLLQEKATIGQGIAEELNPETTRWGVRLARYETVALRPRVSPGSSKG